MVNRVYLSWSEQFRDQIASSLHCGKGKVRYFSLFIYSFKKMILTYIEFQIVKGDFYA